MKPPDPPPELGILPATRKSGKERFLINGRRKNASLLEFWQWSASDLISNARRGRLAEFIVARALGLTAGVRNEWDAHDLTTPAGLKIEIKSCAYLQAWSQKKHSIITYSVRKTRAWTAESNRMEIEVKRHAHLYVFALLFHRDSKQTLDPLNLDQWQFYLLPTKTLDERTRSQPSITLRSLQALCTNPLQRTCSRDSGVRKSLLIRRPSAIEYSGGLCGGSRYVARKACCRNCSSSPCVAVRRRMRFLPAVRALAAAARSS